MITTATLPATDLTGQTLGRYRLLERVDASGTSQLYKGYQAALDRYVAVKVLPDYRPDEHGSWESIQRQARAVAALRHPHIVQVYDFDAIEDVYYLAMEWIEGTTLKALLADKARQDARFTLPEIREIVSAL